MVYSGTVYWLRSTARIALVAIATLTLLQAPQAQAQQPSGQGNQPQVEPADDPTDPNNLRPVSQSNSILSIPGGQRLMTEASSAISNQNYRSEEHTSELQSQ